MKIVHSGLSRAHNCFAVQKQCKDGEGKQTRPENREKQMETNCHKNRRGVVPIFRFGLTQLQCLQFPRLLAHAMQIPDYTDSSFQASLHGGVTCISCFASTDSNGLAQPRLLHRTIQLCRLSTGAAESSCRPATLSSAALATDHLLHNDGEHPQGLL